MRSCDEILDWISAALDDQLNAEEQAALNEHLTHCPACSALYDDLRALQAATVDMEDIPAPAGFTDTVMSAISADPSQEQPDNVIPFSDKLNRKPRPRWSRWVASVAAVAVIAVGAASLPTLMGGNKSASFDTATADDAANYSSTESAVMDQAMPEVAMEEESFDAIQYQSAETDGQTETYGSATEDSAVETAPAASSEPAEQVNGSLADSVVYCGVLTLSDTALPESLDEIEATEDEQGNLTYVVSAEYFYSILNTMQAEEKTIALAPESDDTDPDAKYGLIIVENPS